MNGDALPAERDRTRAVIALLTVLRGEGLTEAESYHLQLLLLAHMAAVCAVALSVDLALLQVIFGSRYATLAPNWPAVARIERPRVLRAITGPELIGVTSKLAAALDAITRDPAAQVWLALHVYAVHGLQHGASFATLASLLSDRYRASLETIEREAKKGGKA